ncbi:MAG TPA: aminotransferase class I/II-fold pyridoxal phosphate-dependent enzyme [Candidatus Nitrosopelagicus sp.]|nr:aminotransferase class I/II-fold pyridoxal phosphate-dependent enzyme [Candidatus Nitrosopelagicus sp.]|tara:strand:- start:1153 stop:2325 length:1173 start_codon:yes stop_codon:yes gene_type:complete
MKVSKKVAGVEYAIRDIVSAAREIEQQGKSVDYLNIGDPVQFGFQPPDNVKQALIDAVNKGNNFYTQSEGLPELLDAIAKKENSKGLSIGPENVVVTNGVSEGLDMVISSIVEDGDEVLLPGPYYPPYASYVRLHGGKPIEFAVDFKNSRPDIDDIKAKISSKTVAICLISPNNPTGLVFDETALKQIVDIANEHDLYLICDEIYDKIIFDQEFTGIGKVAGNSPVIILNGFSKVHLMSGWRVGYIAFNDSPQLDSIRENLPKLARVRISTNLPVQYAALESLRGPQDYIGKFVSELKIHRDYVIKRLNAMNNITCSNPQGAFYAFPKIENNKFSSDKDFVLELLKQKGVLTVHGSGFGTQYGSGHFRIVYLPNMEILESAMNKIEDFVR